MSAFTTRHERDLVFYFDEVEGELGLKSNWDGLIEMAMAGIPDGGTIAQSTNAVMGLGYSAVERERRVEAVLELVPREHVRVLSRYYSSNSGRRAAWGEARRLEQVEQLLGAGAKGAGQAALEVAQAAYAQAAGGGREEEEPRRGWQKVSAADFAALLLGEESGA